MLWAVLVGEEQEEIYLELNRSSGKGERGGGWEALQGLGARAWT